jgi:hypothetical protein
MNLKYVQSGKFTHMYGPCAPLVSARDIPEVAPHGLTFYADNVPVSLISLELAPTETSKVPVGNTHAPVSESQ